MSVPPNAWAGTNERAELADKGLMIEVDGKEYAIDDFEGRELVDAERSFGISLLAELERGSVTGVYAVLYLIKKREDGTFTPDDALALNLGQVQNMLGSPDGAEGQSGPPPARASQRAKKTG